MNNEPPKQQIEETQELGSKVKELLKPENLIGPFNSVQDFMKSLWDEKLLMYEMATVVSTSDRYISVNPDSNLEWFNEEYFKVYNASNARKATKVARIKFRHPTYTIHSDMDRKINWILNSKEKQDLVKLFKEPSLKEPSLTNWEYAILQFNLEAFPEANRDYCLNLTIAKQNQMNDRDPQKYWLPIDLPIPDYTEL